DDACLGGRIVDLTTVARDAGDRGDEDEVSAVAQAALDVLVEEGGVHPEDGAEVDVDDRRPAGLVHVHEELVPGDSGIVDDDVDTAEAGAVLGDAGTGVRCGHVELERRSPDAVGDLGQRVAGGGDVDADDLGAVPGQDLDDGRTDAASGTGHDRDPALEGLLPRPRGGSTDRAGRADL